MKGSQRKNEEERKKERKACHHPTPPKRIHPDAFGNTADEKKKFSKKRTVRNTKKPQKDSKKRHFCETSSVRKWSIKYCRCHLPRDQDKISTWYRALQRRSI